MPLLLRLDTVQRQLAAGVQDRLARAGFALTAAQLDYLSALDCGATFPAAIARRLGLSRQAINRVTREMEAAGLIRLEDDSTRGNQKLVVMTNSGETLALTARRALAEAEAALAPAATLDALKRALATLEKGPTK